MQAISDSDVEAVIIALPLHLHAKVAVEAMMKDKHVLTEKLMAKTVAQCKVMSRVAAEQNLHLATGHQRHYSVLYDNAVNLIRWGVLGEIGLGWLLTPVIAAALCIATLSCFYLLF